MTSDATVSIPDLRDAPLARLPADRLTAPERVGPYRLDGLIGRGGMGSVYAATRSDGEYQGRVAVKLLDHALEDAHLARRFRNERQILARLDHPHIARLLDGGTTEGGRPFLVMELIAGELIDRYCDRRQLSLHQRLRLFQDVCGAVESAHGNLVIHRDLKPGNILVTAEGWVKLVDFGIAKLVAPEPADGSRATETHLPWMTPEYASPEQVCGRPLATASDVYSLGVVLYELLTGRRPYSLEGRAPGEIFHAVCETSPPRPSEVVTRGGLSRRLRGDLDDILLKVLEKDPAQRYPSVAALAEDLARHLDNRPVGARRHTPLYRARKLVRRHTAASAGVAALVFLTLGFVLTLLAQRHQVVREQGRAELERDKALQVAEFLVGLFEVPDPGQASGNAVTAREILDRGAASVRSDPTLEPAAQATLMDAIGRVDRNLGLYAESRPILEQALELNRRLHGDEHPAVAASRAELGEVLMLDGHYDRARRSLEEALELQERLDAPAVDVAASLTHLATLDLATSSGLDPALAGIQRALEIREGALGPDHPDVAATLVQLANIQSLRQEDRASELAFQRALRIHRQILGPEHPKTAANLADLASLYLLQLRFEPAVPLLEEALEITRRALAEEHPLVAVLLKTLGYVEAALGRYGRAEALLRRALEIRTHLGYRHGRTAQVYQNLGFLDFLRGDGERAETALMRCIEISEQALAPDNLILASCLHILGQVYLDQRRFSEADAELHRARDIYANAGLGSLLARSLNDLGRLHLATDRPADAAVAFRRSSEILARRSAAGLTRFERIEWARAHIGLGRVDQGRGRPTEARHAWTRALALLDELSPQSRDIFFLAPRAEVLLLLGDHDAARPTLAELARRGWKARGPSPARLSRGRIRIRRR